MSELTAHLHGRPIGRIEQRQGRVRFTYLDEHRQARGATPLSLSMPLARQHHDDRIVRPWLWGLLPDNDRVLQRWARTFGVSARDPFALLRQVGRDCPGAVQLLDEQPGGAPPPDTVEWLDDAAVGDRIRQLAADEAAWLGRTAGGEFSLAGAQPKFALLRQEGRWGRPQGQLATTHIFKPAIRGLAEIDLCEHLCLETLRHLGLAAVRSELRSFGGASALVVTRFDRLTRGGSVLRVHQEDLCQALGRGPEAKYENEGGPSARDIAGLLRAVQPPSQAERSVTVLVDALLTSWLMAATDAHAKNYAVLLSGGQVRLAPLYDVVSLIPFEPTLHKAKLAMRIGGEYRLPQIVERHWRRTAHDLGLDGDDVVDRGRELAERLPGSLAEVVSRDAVTALGSELPLRLLDGVRAHAGRCARALGS